HIARVSPRVTASPAPLLPFPLRLFLLLPSLVSTPSPSPRLGVTLILLTLASWTVVPLFLRHFTTMIDGWSANGWRYGFSALLWLPILLLAVRRGTFPQHLWKAALLPSFFNAIAQIAFGLAPY
ncbi:MAG: hypothetical protein ACK58T_23165, partial [Phycisphaerae bacterium]